VQEQQGQMLDDDGEERADTLEEMDDDLKDMNDERGERQGLQSELEDQPGHDQANEDPDQLSDEQTQGDTARQEQQ